MSSLVIKAKLRREASCTPFAALRPTTSEVIPEICRFFGSCPTVPTLLNVLSNLTSVGKWLLLRRRRR